MIKDQTPGDRKLTWQAKAAVARGLLDAMRDEWELAKPLPWQHDKETDVFHLELPHEGGTAKYRISREVRHCTGYCACSCCCQHACNEKIVLEVDVPGEVPFELCNALGYNTLNWVWKLLSQRMRAKSMKPYVAPISAYVQDQQEAKRNGTTN